MLSDTLTAGLDEASLAEFTDKLRSHVRQQSDQLSMALEATWAQIDAEKRILEHDLSGRAAAAARTRAERLTRWKAGQDMSDLPPLEGDIFAQSNMSLGLAVGNATFLGARVHDDLFGATPPFILEGAGMEDEQQAANLNRWFIDKALDPRSRFNRVASIVCDTAAAHPYALAEVRWGSYDPPFVEVDENGELIRPPSEKGLIFEAVHHRDFIFDPALPYEFNKQPFTARLKDLGREDLEDYLDREILTQAEYDSLLGEMQSTPRSLRVDKTTAVTADLSVGGWLPCIEAYFKFPIPVSVNGHTVYRQARLYALVSWQNQTVIFADMLSRVYPKGRVPVFLISQEHGEDSLFRKGMLAKAAPDSLVLDTLLNAIHFRSWLALNGPHTLKRNSIKELKDNDRPLPMIADLMLTKEGNDPNSEILTPLTASQPIEATPQFITEWIQQQSQLKTGVSGAAAGDVGSLPQSSTATGVKQVISHGAVLLKKPESCIRDGFAELLNLAALMAVKGMDETEYFRFTEPSSGAVRLESVKRPPNLDTIRFDVRLKISKVVAEERIRDGNAIMDIIGKWLGFADPTVEQQMIPAVASQLSMVGMSNPMDTLIAINNARLEAQMQMMQQQAEAAQAEQAEQASQEESKPAA